MVVELVAGAARASIFPDAGGRLGQLCVDDVELLRGPEHAHLGWGWWGSYPLLPWSNRIPGGVVPFEGRELRVPVNWEDGSALHGLTAWLPWTLVGHDASWARLEIAVREGDYDVIGRQSFTMREGHLEHVLEVVNAGSERVPVGLGIHPWFPAGEIRVPADRMWPGSGPMPTGAPVAVGADEDLRTPRVPPPMDRCYTGLIGTVADAPGLRLHWSGPITQVVVFSGAPGWVCVEPVTMANDGFNMANRGVEGTGVIALDAGQSTSVTYRYEWVSTS